MQTLLLTIKGSARSIDLELPAEVPMVTLLPILVRLCVKGLKVYTPQWSLWSADTQTYLNITQSLLEAGVVNGAILELQPTTKSEPVDIRGFQPKTIRPSETSGGIGVSWQQLR